MTLSLRCTKVMILFIALFVTIISNSFATNKIYINNGFELPAQSQFPRVPLGLVFRIGPKAYMTAAHVAVPWGQGDTREQYKHGSLRGLYCVPKEDYPNHPFHNGKPLTLPDGTMMIIGPKYCETWLRRNDQDYYKNYPEMKTLANYGIDGDWAILVMENAQKVPGSEVMLSLDLSPPLPQQQSVVIGKINAGEGSDRINNAAALFEITAVDENTGSGQSMTGTQFTEKGDSGSPWLRIYPDQTVGVMAVHSTGNYPTPTYPATSGFVLFQAEEDMAVIRNFIAATGVEICGINLVCPSYQLPVRIEDLLRP